MLEAERERRTGGPWLRAVLEEMRFFDHIMADHGRLLRGSLDLGEDALIRQADHFAGVFTSLAERSQAMDPADEMGIRALVNETIPHLMDLDTYKLDLERELTRCTVHAIIGAEVLAHIHRELLFYLGFLRRTLDQPTPLRRELDLPDGDTRMLAVPRRLIGRTPDSLDAIALEYGLFWLHAHAEHAMVLAQHTRPAGQRRLHDALEAWQRDLAALERDGMHLFTRMRDEERPGRRLHSRVAHWAAESLAAMVKWRNYLASLVDELRRCAIPSGQTNFWPALAHHMRMEADYLVEALRQVLSAAEERGRRDGRMEFSREMEREDWRS
ncbi:MAG: DUF2935 domain-containing protein [Chitinophagales bacterium]